MDDVIDGPAGAYTLSENSLYTTEAFLDYLDHLTDDGVLVLNVGRGPTDRRGAEAPATFRGLAQAAREMIVLIERARGDHHARAFGGEPFGDRRADTTAGAGDDDPSSFEPSHAVLLAAAS